MTSKKHLNINQDLFSSFKVYLLSIFFIIIYTLIVYSVANLFFKEKATGSLIYDDQGNVRGSLLIGQEFISDKYFHGRISSKSESKCDIALYNEIFKESINNRHELRPDLTEVSIITSSNSLKDPYIMTHEAISQAKRVAESRKMDISEVLRLIDQYKTPPSTPFFELDIVNIMYLNAKLDGYL